MKLSELKIRDKLLCRMADNNGSEFLVRIEDIIDEQFLTTDLPLSAESYVRFKEGTILDMIYCTENGIIYFKAQVDSVSKYDNDPFMVLQKITDGERVQRREYFRLSINDECLIKSFSNLVSVGNKKYEATLENISAGGVKLYMRDSYFKKGEEIYITFSSSTGFEGRWGKILSIDRAPKNKADFNYSLSVKFIYLTSKTQDSLVRVILNKQREMSRI